jgi:hypothetical protein
MSRKGFAPILALLILGGFLAVGGGVYLVQKKVKLPVTIVPDPMVATSTQKNAAIRVPVDVWGEGERLGDMSVSTFENKNTGDEVSFRNAPGGNRTFLSDILVNGQKIGQVSGQNVWVVGFSPDGKYFAFKTLQVSGAFHTYLHLVALKEKTLSMVQLPRTSQDYTGPRDNPRRDIVPFASSYSWNSDNTAKIEFYFISYFDDEKYYRVSPIETWRYDLSKKEYFLSQPGELVIQTIRSQFASDLRDPRKLLGATHNVFVGKVLSVLGTGSSDGVPTTRFEVRVVKNIKGGLQGTVTVEQAGGYRDGTLYVFQGDYVSDQEGEAKYLLQPGSVYLLPTRAEGSVYFLSTFPNTTKLITSNEMSENALLDLARSNADVLTLEAAYPDEILDSYDIRDNKTYNSYQSIHAPINCLKTDEEKRSEYRVSASGAYIGLVTFREGVVFVHTKDARTCKDLISANREGTEYRDVSWEGDIFKFIVTLTRRPLISYKGEIDMKTGAVRWSE